MGGTPSEVFGVVLVMQWALFLWEQYLAYRQYKVHLNAQKRPEHVKDIISEEEFAKARAYKLDKHRFGFLSDWFGQVETTVILCYGFLPYVWEKSEQWPLPAVSFIALTTLVSTVVHLPFSLYDTFVIEQTHGFNKQTIGFFFVDLAKKQAVSLVISAPILLAIEWIVDNGGDYFFVYVWAFISAVIFLLLTVYPAFIAPLFDKYIPLPDGQLKTKIEGLAASLSYPLKKLYVVHGSKRSAHSNAYMYGFWKNKRIVLYDTLLSQSEREKVIEEIVKDGGERPEETEQDKARGMSDEEVVAVLGHELGHWHHSHTVYNLIFTEVNLLLMMWVFASCYRWRLMYAAFGFSSTPTLIGLILVFQYIMAPYNQLLSIVQAMWVRRMEFQADDFGASLGYAAQLQSALVKLSKDNLSLPIDDPLYSACNHSHPPIPERIAALKAYKGDGAKKSQ